MRDIGSIIESARERQGLSRAELAAALNVSAQTVAKWENDTALPNAENLVALIKMLNIDFSGPAGKEPPSYNSMGSIREIFKIGRGPSSSHTIGPERACLRFRSLYPDADSYRVVLYGSLAKTGKGHGSDTVIKKTLSPAETLVEFDPITPTPHPNTMDMQAFRGGELLGSVRVLSIGGGNVLFGDEVCSSPVVYPHSSFSEISRYCAEKDIALWQYVRENEDSELWDYLLDVWRHMKSAVQRGLRDEGILPGGLSVHKKAKQLFEATHIDESAETRENRLICAYAFAVSEQNASGETIVTSPTCGSAGVLPAVLYYEQQKHGYTDEQILRAIATAGIIGNIIKTNASISGAECGCQAEIGSACAMAAAALGALFELNTDKIEYAAEIALEHHLGLTCDPVCGLVQIPCIERNAVAAMRAINSVSLASLLWNTRKISFDNIVETMKETGHDLLPIYRETAEGGMAKNYNPIKK